GESRRCHRSRRGARGPGHPAGGARAVRRRAGDGAAGLRRLSSVTQGFASPTTTRTEIPMRVLKSVLLGVTLLLPGLSQAYDKALVEEMLQSQEGIAGLKRHEATIDGQRISYLDNERVTAGRTIMLVHGFGDSSASWLF